MASRWQSLAVWQKYHRQRQDSPGCSLSGPGVLEECYTKAGFRDVAVRAVPVQRHFPSTAEAVGAMKDSFPRLNILLNKLDDDNRALAWREIERQLSQFEGPNGFEAPGEWLVGVGTK